jgi:hypothetical protein
MFDPGKRPLEPEREQPILYVGLMGFSLQQRAALEKVLTRPSGGCPAWRVGVFADADAWCVNGARISLLPDGNLRVTAGLPTEHTLNLRLEDVKRPIGFSTPLAARKFEATCTFDPASEADTHKMLRQFEGWLQPQLFRAALGALIVKRGVTLRGGSYQVRHRDTLLAVLDFRHGQAAISPTALPADLEDAIWDRQPGGASEPPERFLSCTPAQLIWTYARHSARDLLPRRYRDEVVFYRHAPRVPLSWLRDSELRLLSALSTGPGDFRTLCQRTGITEVDMARDLACLYYAGAVTSTRSKAAEPFSSRQDAAPPRATADDIDSLPDSHPNPSFEENRTVPATLDRSNRLLPGQ